MKTLLFIAFFVVPFCDAYSEAPPWKTFAEVTDVSEKMWNNYGNSDILSHSDPFLDILNKTIDGDWDRIRQFLYLAGQTNKAAYIKLNFEAIWLILQSDTRMLHSETKFQFSTYVEKNVHLNKEFKKNVMLVALSEAAILLPELFYPTNDMDFYLKEAIFEYLNSLNETSLDIMFHQIYDNLLSKRSVVSVANRLFIAPFNNDQLTIAYSELASRNESRTDQEAIEVINQNREDLKFRKKKDLKENILLKADIIHLTNYLGYHTLHKPYYIGMCPNATNVCMPSAEPINIHVERSRLSDDKRSIRYAFKIPGVGYISWKGDSSSISKEKMWWEIQGGHTKFLVYDHLIRDFYISNSGHYLCLHGDFFEVQPITASTARSINCEWTMELGI